MPTSLVFIFSPRVLGIWIDGDIFFHYILRPSTVSLPYHEAAQSFELHHHNDDLTLLDFPHDPE